MINSVLVWVSMSNPHLLFYRYDLFTVHDWWNKKSDFYLVVGLCNGGTLMSFMKERGLQRTLEMPEQAGAVENAAVEAEQSSTTEAKITEEEQSAPASFFGVNLTSVLNMIDNAADMIAAPDSDDEEEDGDEGDSIVDDAAIVVGMDEEDVKLVMLQHLGCVNYLHQNNVIHTNICPQNILLRDENGLTTLKIIDFDESALLHTGKEQVKCNNAYPEYSSPCVYRGEPYGYACDVWACGVVAYQLLSNRFPFGDSREKSTEEIKEQVLRGVVSFCGSAWDHVSHEAKTFLGLVFNPDPAARPNAQKLLQHPWLLPKPGSAARDAVNLMHNKAAMGAMSNLRT